MPALQFYPGDWRKDPAVQALNYHDRGIWFEILCLMHESSERGVLLLNNQPIPEEALANALGLDIQIMKISLTKILAYGAAKVRHSDGAIYSKRMVNDEKLCQTRREVGKKGGNPVLLNQNTTTIDNQIITPSTSSSLSSSASLFSEPSPSAQASDTDSLPVLVNKKNNAQLSKVSPAKKTANPLNDETWKRYSSAYFNRYGTGPVRNAIVNSQIANIVKRLGEEAPAVAEFYVWHNKSIYVQKMHDVGMLLVDCSGLRTQWATNTKVTSTQAMRSDRHAATDDAFNRVIAELQAQESKNGSN